MPTPTFVLHKVTPGQVEELVAFYNHVIQFNNQQGREVRWPRFTKASMGELIAAGVVFVVQPTKETAGYPSICLALFLDDRPDDDTWPPDEGLLPNRSLRLGRMAAAPELTHQRFTVRHGWPLILAYARQRDYKALRCEAHPFPGLHRYYSQTLGMTYCGLRTYHDRHHDGEITANRYLLMLK